MFRISEVFDKFKRVGQTIILLALALVIGIVGYGFYVFVTRVSGQAVVSERIEAVYQKVQLQARRHGLKKSDFLNYGTGEAQAILVAFAGEMVDDNVRGINIVNRNQVTIWSSDVAQVGIESTADKSELLRAMKGEVVAAHPFGNRPFIFPMANVPADLFVPIHADDGSTMGVIVVSKDFSDVVSLNASIAVVTIVFVVVVADLLWLFLYLRLRQQKYALLREEGKIGSVLEHMPIGLAVIHKDGEILVWNEQMLAMGGMDKAKEVIGKNAFTLPLFKLLGLDVPIRAGTAGKPFETDTRVTMPQGQESWRHWKGVPIPASGGKEVAYLLLMAEDSANKKKSANKE